MRLTQRERRVYRLRRRGVTARVVAAEFGLTKERIYQIEGRAKRKMLWYQRGCRVDKCHKHKPTRSEIAGMCDAIERTLKP